MTRTVLVADEVAELLGDEQVARLRGPEWAQRVQCWTCDGWIEPEADAAVLLLRVPELEDRDTGAAPSFAVHAHPTCQPSRVVTLSWAEVEARRAAHAAAQPDAGEDPDSVDVVATVFDTGRGSGFPVVMVSYRADIMVDQAGPDRVDLLTATMLERGWHPITTLTEPPGPGPHGWRVRFTHAEGHAAAPGLLEVVDPTGQAETVAHVEPARYWRPAIVRTGQTVLVQGSNYLTDWARRGRADVKRAMRAGLLTGGTVPVELAGPGNDVRGSVFR